MGSTALCMSTCSLSWQDLCRPQGHDVESPCGFVQFHKLSILMAWRVKGSLHL